MVGSRPVCTVDGHRLGVGLRERGGVGVGLGDRACLRLILTLSYGAQSFHLLTGCHLLMQAITDNVPHPVAVFSL